MSTSQYEVPQLGLEGISSDGLHRIPALHVSQAVFARHNTFHPRFGWLKKGFDAALDDPGVFTRHDAPITLGVGINMVRAIRYWCLATRVLSEGERGTGVSPTVFGLELLGSQGLDPFLEDLGSLWLLHWRLAGNADLATAWWYTWFAFTRTEFTADELSKALEEFVKREFPVSRYADSSLQKDAACIVRMYGELSSGSLSEESIHCPFAELALLRPTGRRTYAFQVGPKPGLSGEIVAAACLEFAAATSQSARTIALGALLRAPGSPGLAFRLGESALYAALEEVVAVEPALAVADAGGLVQLSFSEDPLVIADRLISRHYQNAFAGTL